MLIEKSVQSASASEKSPARDGQEQPFIRPEMRIAGVYVLMASVWIIGSDTLLKKICGDDANLWFLQSTKGINFVITTRVLLYLVLRRAYGGWRRSELRRLDEARAASEGFRSLSARIQSLREEERTRISREVHDELGQQLTAIKMQLRLIENQIADRDDRSLNPLIDQLVEVVETVDETLRSVKRISNGLRPATLDDLGLASALLDEAAEFARNTGINCELVMSEFDMRLPPEVETAVFRIFQETLTNVARHESRCGMRRPGSRPRAARARRRRGHRSIATHQSLVTRFERHARTGGGRGWRHFIQTPAARRHGGGADDSLASIPGCPTFRKPRHEDSHHRRSCVGPAGHGFTAARAFGQS